MLEYVSLYQDCFKLFCQHFQSALKWKLLFVKTICRKTQMSKLTEQRGDPDFLPWRNATRCSSVNYSCFLGHRRPYKTILHACVNWQFGILTLKSTLTSTTNQVKHSAVNVNKSESVVSSCHFVLSLYSLGSFWVNVRCPSWPLTSFFACFGH